MIKELKRKLTIRKEKYRKDLSYVGRIFDVKEDDPNEKIYINNF